MRLHIHYSLYYLISVSLYAFLLAFFPIHCESIGFEPFEIALLTIAATLAPMVGAPLTLHFAHTHAAPARLILMLIVCAILSYLPLLSLMSFWPCMFFWFVCLACKRGADSLIDAQAIRDSAVGKILFERVRLWGSIGFLISSIGMGLFVRRFGIASVLYFGLLVLVSILLIASLVRPSLSTQSGAQSSGGTATPFFSKAVKSSPFVFLLLTMLFNSASHAAYYTYFSLYLSHLNWGPIEIAACWNIGVLAEIIIFIVFQRICRHMSLERILQISMILTALRWAILFISDYTPVILCSQLLHGFSYGTCYLASMKLVHEILPDSVRDRGLGWLTAVGLGLGSILGRLLFGHLAQSSADYTEIPQLFLISSLIALFGILASLGVRTTTRLLPDSTLLQESKQ